MAKRTFEDVLFELIELMPNPITAQVSKEQEREIAESFKSIKALPDFFKETMGADMRRYFMATPEEKERIKGAFSRTMYLLSLALPKPNVERTKNLLAGPRKSKSELQKL